MNFIHTTMEMLKEFEKSLKHSPPPPQTDPFRKVVNLSSKYFSYFVFKFLNRNLNFIPNPGKLNIKTFEKDVKKFSRKIMIQAHFGPQCKDNSNMFQPTSKSTWTPPNPDHTVKTFIKFLEKDLLNNIENHVIKQNLSKEEIKSLNKLKSMEDIIITRADKGGAVVILDIQEYIAEANQHLEDQHIYTNFYNRRSTN